MSKLKPAFKKDGDSVTAGNALGLNDAAAALLLVVWAEAERRSLKPLASAGVVRARRLRPEDHGHRPGAGVA